MLTEDEETRLKNLLDDWKNRTPRVNDQFIANIIKKKSKKICPGKNSAVDEFIEQSGLPAVDGNDIYEMRF